MFGKYYIIQHELIMTIILVNFPIAITSVYMHCKLHDMDCKTVKRVLSTYLQV